MALNLGQILGGAGIVATRMREAEESERVAQQNQLKIEEQNRLARMKAQIAQRPLPSLTDVEAGAPYAGLPMFEFQQPMPQRQMPAPPVPPGYQGPTREQLAFEEANITPGPVGRGKVSPVAASTVAPQLRPFDSATTMVPPSVEAIGLKFEAARTAHREAKARLDKFGSRQKQADPMGYEAARMEEMRAREVRDAAQREWESVAAPYTRPVQVQPRVAGARTSPVAPQGMTPTPQQVSDEFAGIGAPAAPAAAPAGETRVAPAVQAQRDVEAARIRAQELGTVARAESELARIDEEIKKATNGEVKNILRAERGRVDEARKLLAAAPAAAAPAAAAPVAAAAAAAAPVTAPPAAPVLEPAVTASPVAQNTANAVLAATPQMLQTNPEQLSRVIRDTQEFAARQRMMAVQQRNDQAALARIYMSSGTADGITQGRQLMADIGKMDMALMQFDKQMRDSIIYMQGMEGLQEFARTNNPSRLAGVWSYFSPAPVGLQQRSDGMFDLFYNGQRSQEGLSKDQVQQLAQQAMFQSARDAITKAAELKNKLILEQQFGPERTKAMTDIMVALINQQGQLTKAQLDNMKETVTQVEGGVVYKTPQGLVYISPGGVQPLPGGGEQRIMQVTPIQIPGR